MGQWAGKNQEKNGPTVKRDRSKPKKASQRKEEKEEGEGLVGFYSNGVNSFLYFF